MKARLMPIALGVMMTLAYFPSVASAAGANSGGGATAIRDEKGKFRLVDPYDSSGGGDAALADLQAKATAAGIGELSPKILRSKNPEEQRLAVEFVSVGIEVYKIIDANRNVFGDDLPKRLAATISKTQVTTLSESAQLDSSGGRVLTKTDAVRNLIGVSATAWPGISERNQKSLALFAYLQAAGENQAAAFEAVKKLSSEASGAKLQ